MVDHAEVHRAVAAHLEKSRMIPGVVETILRHQRDMVAGRAVPGCRPPMTVRLTDDVLHGLQRGKVRRRLIAAAERRNIALEASLQLQAERRGDDHVARRLVLARMEMARVQIDRKEDRVREKRAESLDNEQCVVGISSQNTDGSGAFPLVMNPGDQRAHVIDLTRAFRAVPGCVVGLGGGSRLGSPGGSRRVVARHFSVQAAQIAVAKDVQRE